MSKNFKKLFFFVLVSILIFSSCSEETVYNDPFIALTTEEVETFTYGETRDFTLSLEGDYVAATTEVPEGWTATVDGNNLSVTAPDARNQSKEDIGAITITLKGYNDIEASASFDVKAYHLLTFENIPGQYLAGPTAYGENLYNGEYTGFLDSASGLFLNTTTTGYKFASGGIAISQWNDMETADYLNQCSVYFSDDNHNGGYDNSKTFAVAYCPTFGECGAYMYFQDNEDEHLFDHAYFTNNTYAVLSMKNGDSFAKAFSYEDGDWFKLTITGISASGETTGEVDVYLADFRTPDAYGILKEWKFVDLTPLGKVNKIEFSMSSSDGSGMWMNTPAYFCMDNIAIHLAD